MGYRCLIVLYFIGADKEVLQGEIVAAGVLPAVIKLCSSSDAALQAEAADLLKVRFPSSVYADCCPGEATLQGMFLKCRICIDVLRLCF